MDTLFCIRIFYGCEDQYQKNIIIGLLSFKVWECFKMITNKLACCDHWQKSWDI